MIKIELNVEPMLVLFFVNDKYCFVHLQSIVWYIYKYCFVHYKNYNVHVYYKHCFAHLQDDLLINLVIEQMINDTDPGTSSWQKHSDTSHLVC